MRQTIISLIITVFLFGVFSYFLANLEVFNRPVVDSYRVEYNLLTAEEFYSSFQELRRAGLIFQLINVQSVYAMTITIFFLSMSFFTTIHLFTDKFFFKKFYEQPDLGVALRRGLFFALLLVALLYIRVMGLWDFIIVGATISTIIVVELFVTYSSQLYTQQKESNTTDEQNEKHTTAHS
ncbi:hypothetical protein KC717_02610 [Candidatus Dojkabacteria bacterium]|uniref:Uncharacterized protein n=1 Tax=Candidatus Dojkabacteria bacterium TaxID=2099670 RepID=A0A955L8F0_9BACT|nr:hypothetical protein [Candidatus Dojkabacteria bacterium]